MSDPAAAAPPAVPAADRFPVVIAALGLLLALYIVSYGAARGTHLLVRIELQYPFYQYGNPVVLEYAVTGADDIVPEVTYPGPPGRLSVGAWYVFWPIHKLETFLRSMDSTPVRFRP